MIFKVSFVIFQKRIKMKTSVSLYSLAIRPDSAICLMVKEIKRLLRKLFGRHFGSANSEAHLSLFEFYATNSNYHIILNVLRKEIARLSSFEINFSKFDEFAGSNTFFISPSEKSSKSIIQHCKQIKPVFYDLKKSEQIIRYKDSSFKKPHMTVARQLTSELLNLAKESFIRFEGTFMCDAFVIRKFNPQIGQYEVIDSLPMLGQSDESGVQLTLF